MRFTKPAWVAHQESGDKKRPPIYSINVHPDGSRIATGGADGKIKIWATLPIVQPEYDDSTTGVEASSAPPKKLCTLSMHAGPVLCVRWSYSGKWLASGSDDAIIMIWDLDPHGGGKVWGSDDVNVEGWKALKRLPGHDSDVTDLSFSPQDRYLASVGLDSKVLLWNGANLELLRKLDAHQGFVKGVCWDPVGQFLATQSDDRSVKIWNTTDWSLETSITQPFEKSPSAFFTRLSWSPDGAHITASNAKNNNGYVFVAAVISRSSWSSNISLVGHENTIGVSAYNPHIFRRDANKPVHTQNICSVVALGSNDLSISIWQTKSARPLLVAKDVFSAPIMDLSWSQDGLTLYACSSDGFIGVFDFDEHEMEGIAPLSVQADYLKLFNFTPPPIVEPYLPQSQSFSRAPQQYQYQPHPQQHQQQHQQQQPYAYPQPGNPMQESGPPETVYVNGKKKKRIQPVFVSHLSSGPGGYGHGPGMGPGGPLPTMSNQPLPPTNGAYPPSVPQQQPPSLHPYNQNQNQNQNQYPPPPPHHGGPSRHGPPGPYEPYPPPGPSSSHHHHHHPSSSHGLPPPMQQQQQQMYRNQEPYSHSHSHSHSRMSREPYRDVSRDTSLGPTWEGDRDRDRDPYMDGGDRYVPNDDGLRDGRRERERDREREREREREPQSRGRTLGGDRPKRDSSIPITIKEIRTIAVPLPLAAPAGGGMDVVDGGGGGAKPGEYLRGSGTVVRLPIPPVRNVVSAKVEEREEDVFEGKNSEDVSVPAEVSLTVGKNVEFVDFVSSAVVAVTASTVFCAAGLEDSSLNVYSMTGRRIMPPIVLDSPCVLMASCKWYLMVITSTARLYVWNVKTQKAHMSSVVVQPLLPTSAPSILSAVVRPSGSPVLLLSDGIAYSYDIDLGVWVRVSEARWSLGSDAWEGKQRSTANRALASQKGVIGSLEAAIADLDLRNNSSLQEPPEKLAWWNEAMTLGHLESRMHAARLLDSPAEYKSNLLAYARKISEEGLKTKAEELIKELCGPLYWKPSREESTWNPTVLGMQKRDLLKDVVGVFARSRSLAKLGQDWQDTMKKAQSNE